MPEPSVDKVKLQTVFVDTFAVGDIPAEEAVDSVRLVGVDVSEKRLSVALGQNCFAVAVEVTIEALVSLRSLSFLGIVAVEQAVDKPRLRSDSVVLAERLTSRTCSRPADQ